jgi:hypothetical protein
VLRCERTTVGKGKFILSCPYVKNKKIIIKEPTRLTEICFEWCPEKEKREQYGEISILRYKEEIIEDSIPA